MSGDWFARAAGRTLVGPNSVGPALAGLALAAALAAVACGGGESTSGAAAAEDTAAAGGARQVNVRVRTLEPVDFVDRIEMTGNTQARRTVQLSAEISGRVERLAVEKGDRVAAGDTIVKLDDAELRAQLKEARAQAALARETFRRRRQLFERDSAISELSFLQARYDAEQAEGRVEALEARKAKTVVRAPFGGVVDRRPVELGTMLSPGDPVATVVDLRPVEVSAGVPERYAADVAVGDSGRVTFRFAGADTLTGRVTYVGAAVDPDSRTFPVELAVPNPDLEVKPEMVATVSLVRRRLEGVLAVPQDAVLRTEGGFAVYVVESAEGEGAPVARRRAVTLGPRERDMVVVEEGLAAGDRLIVAGQQQVADGDRVRVLEEG